MAMRHPYDVLGVEPDADLATIKRAFRARAKEVHPDRSTDPRATARFRELYWAYEQATRDAATRAMWASIHPRTRNEPPAATSAVDVDADAATAYESGDPDLGGVPASAFCTRAYQERLTRVVVTSLVGAVVLFWVSAVVSHF